MHFGYLNLTVNRYLLRPASQHRGCLLPGLLDTQSRPGGCHFLSAGRTPKPAPLRSAASLNNVMNSRLLDGEASTRHLISIGRRNRDHHPHSALSLSGSTSYVFKKRINPQDSIPTLTGFLSQSLLFRQSLLCPFNANPGLPYSDSATQTQHAHIIRDGLTALTSLDQYAVRTLPVHTHTLLLSILVLLSSMVYFLNLNAHHSTFYTYLALNLVYSWTPEIFQ